MAEIEYQVPKMVGRDKELDQLKEFLHAAIRGKGNVVLVSGEAGIGKTRLVKEVEAYAESSGVQVLEGRCLYESPTPFLPFREALRSVFQVSKSDALPLQETKIKNVIRKAAPHFEEAIPVVSQILAGATVAFRTYRDEKGLEKGVKWRDLFERDEGLEAISSLLVAISEKQPLLLFIDDLHLADTPSLSLLYYVARDAQNSKILVVGAYRPEEITKTYEGTVHPLLDVKQRMSRDYLFQKIELKRLSQIDGFDLIQSMLEADLGGLAKLVYEETEGNPFFAIETLRLLMQQKVLIKEDGHWKLSKKIENIEIPPRVYDVILHRINALKDEERDLLDCASVVGEEFPSGLVESVSSLDRIKLLKSLNNIERKYHLIHSSEDGYRFDHLKIKEILYNEITPDLRKEYHLLIAKYVEERNKDRLKEVVNQLAYHYYQSGNAQKAIPYLLAAGRDAAEKWAAFEAVRLYSQALKIMGNDERWSEDRTRTLEALGDVCALTDQHEKANECYRKGMASAKDDVARDRIRRKIRRRKILDKNGVKLAYYVYGEGEPTLVFVVAWIGPAEFWTPQVNFFSQNFKMVTIDMRGAGESDKPADNYTLDLYVDDLNSIIEELQEEDFVLIGESMGASIAIKYVAKYPGKVSKLVLLGGTPKQIATDDFPHGVPSEVAQRLLTFFQKSYSKGLKAFIKLIFPEPGTEYLRELAFKLSQKTTKEIAVNVLHNFFKEDIRPLLGKINIPTLIVHGENDMADPLDGAKYMHENIPGSKMYIFKDKGHVPSITATDKLNEILNEFIKTGEFREDQTAAEKTKSRMIYVETVRQAVSEPEPGEVSKVILSGPEGIEHAVVEGHLTASKEVTVGEDLEVRLDLINVAKTFCLLVRIDNIIPPCFKPTVSPPQYTIENGSIDMKGRRLEPLKLELVKIRLAAAEAGVVNLSPHVTYVDETGNFRTCKPESITVTVHPKLAFKFKTKAAESIFDYLTDSFVEDYMRRRLIVQEAGWRSLGQIVRNAKVSSRSVYGSSGHHGSAISELKRRGLVETRIFLAERGRGGKITKARIFYEKDTIKRYVDHKVAKNG